MGIELTEDQRRAIAQVKEGPPVLTDPETKQDYVLVPADFYERILGSYDDSPWTAEEMAWMFAQSGRSIGWDDPLMDEYDHLEEPNK